MLCPTPEKRIIKGHPFEVGFDRSQQRLQGGAPSVPRTRQAYRSLTPRTCVTICSGLYLLIGIPALLQRILSHSRWYKKTRSGQPWYKNSTRSGPDGHSVLLWE